MKLLKLEGNSSFLEKNLSHPIECDLVALVAFYSTNPTPPEPHSTNDEKSQNKGENKVKRDTPKYIPFDTINVFCNLADGMIVMKDDHNHEETDLIATFRTRATFREPIIYEPADSQFLPVHNKKIKKVQLQIKNENGELIDFGGAPVTVILSIKKFYKNFLY